MALRKLECDVRSYSNVAGDHASAFEYGLAYLGMVSIGL